MTGSKRENRPFRREIELDFLRGIAILMVLDFHQGAIGLLGYPAHLLGFANPGWMGVSIFFVLSGFLVGGLLMKEWKVRGRIDTKRFLIRRGFKIWPQYYFYLFIMLVLGHRSLRELWGNLLNIQNYVGGVAHTWSLAVEEHAYLVIVFFLYVASRLRLRMRTVFVVLACMAVAASLLRVYSIRHGWSYFTPTHLRIDGILYGVLLATLYHFAPEQFHRLQRMWWIWVTLLVAALLEARFARGWWEPSVGLDFANFVGIALLMLLYRHQEGKRRSWVYRLIAWIGLYSYGIYLWHVSVDAPVHLVDKHLHGWMAVAWDGTMASVLAIGLGWLTSKVIEFPSLRLRDRLFPRKVDSAVGTPAELEPEQPAVQQA